jgi:excisionase family DNA binding protein
MDKKRNPQNPTKGSISAAQEQKLDELAEKIKSLPESRKKIIGDLMNKRLLNSKEVCAILGISLPALRRWMAEGKISYVKVSRYTKFHQEEILRLVYIKESLSVAEVAEILGIGVIAVRNMIERGEIKAFRVSDRGHWHINRDEVEKILESAASASKKR